MKTKIIAAVAVPAAATLGLTGCASAAASCVVQHGYAIVIFQNGMANNSSRFVTHFQLNVMYESGGVVSRFISSRIVLRTANGGNPPVIVRTYRARDAVRCHVDKVAAHR